MTASGTGFVAGVLQTRPQARAGLLDLPPDLLRVRFLFRGVPGRVPRYVPERRRAWRRSGRHLWRCLRWCAGGRLVTEYGLRRGRQAKRGELVSGLVESGLTPLGRTFA